MASKFSALSFPCHDFDLTTSVIAGIVMSSFLKQAMNMLHMMRNSDRTLQEMLKLSPLKAWLVRHGHSSIVKFAQLEVSDFQAPLVFQVM